MPNFEPDELHLLEKPMPNSPDAERAVLGAVLLDNGLIAQAIELLQPEDFYVPAHRSIFRVMIMLFEVGSEINSILIGEELRKTSSLESVGGISFITNLTYGLPHFANIEHYAKLIKGKSLLRQLVKAGNKIAIEALDEDDTPEIILDHAEHEIFKLADAQAQQGFIQLATLVQNSLDNAHAIQESGTVVTGLSTGLVDVDGKTLGLQKTDLIILAARPSMGKTSLGINIAQNAAIREGAHVAVFSLEMSREQLGERILCTEAKVDAMKMRAGYLNVQEWVRLEMTAEEISGARLRIDDTPGINPLGVRAKCRRTIVEHGDLDLVVVDYLQLMSGPTTRSESRQQEVSAISREMKAIAKELNVPLLLISQLSRAPENRTNHRPILSDLRESGSIEQDADVVAFLYREAMYKTHEPTLEANDNLAEFILAKHRRGPTGVVSLHFQPEFTLFSNLYSEH